MAPKPPPIGKPVPAPKVSAPTKAPVPKVAAAGGAGIAGTLLVFIAQRAGVDLPPEVAAAIITVVAFVAGYITKDKAKL